MNVCRAYAHQTTPFTATPQRVHWFDLRSTFWTHVLSKYESDINTRIIYKLTSIDSFWWLNQKSIKGQPSMSRPAGPLNFQDVTAEVLPCRTKARQLCQCTHNNAWPKIVPLGNVLFFVPLNYVFNVNNSALIPYVRFMCCGLGNRIAL